MPMSIIPIAVKPALHIAKVCLILLYLLFGMIGADGQLADSANL
jgi:hypothetical protein